MASLAKIEQKNTEDANFLIQLKKNTICKMLDINIFNSVQEGLSDGGQLSLSEKKRSEGEEK